MRELRVLEDPAAELARRLVAAAQAGAAIALTGGSTPGRAYALARDADWRRASVWFTDERCVDPADERSNYGLAAHALLDHVEAGAVHRIQGELGPQAAADAYDAELAAVDALDLVVLGLGSDGHIASLFPGRPEVAETRRRAVAVPEAGLEPFVARVSLTLPVIRAARAVVFLVTGAGKAPAVALAFGGGEPTVPGALVQDALVLMDADAAAGLA